MTSPLPPTGSAGALLQRIKLKYGYQHDLHVIVLLASIPAAIVAATLILATTYSLLVIAWLAVGVVYLGSDTRNTVMATYDRHFLLSGIVLLLWPLLAWAVRTNRW